MTEKVLDKFLRYVKIDTQSQEDQEPTPSTSKQFNLGRLLEKELAQIGVQDIELDEHCYLFGTIPSNLPTDHPAYGKVPTIGLLAHMDTSPDVSGKDVKPQFVENYQGGDIVVSKELNVIIKESENPNLKKCIGHTIITSDGTTLLGADDKAGVASIMATAEYLINNPQILHGRIRIAFTPDEEIGQGTKFFDIKKFGADYAYTVDGDYPGEINKETFSANAAIITVYGRDIHPGSAKDIMVNSVRIIADIIDMLPKCMSPETTENYEPFIHPHTLEGTVGKSVLRMLMRDFETAGLAKQQQILENIVCLARTKYPNAKIDLEIKEQYRNMKDYMAGHDIVNECMWDACLKAGVTPEWKPIRGGTDGSRLTEMGLPTPNFYAGGQNFHSRQEWISAEALEIVFKTLIQLPGVWVEKYK